MTSGQRPKSKTTFDLEESKQPKDRYIASSKIDDSSEMESTLEIALSQNIG